MNMNSRENIVDRHRIHTLDFNFFIFVRIFMRLLKNHTVLSWKGLYQKKFLHTVKIVIMAIFVTFLI